MGLFATDLALASMEVLSHSELTELEQAPLNREFCVGLKGRVAPRIIKKSRNNQIVY